MEKMKELMTRNRNSTAAVYPSGLDSGQTTQQLVPSTATGS